MAQTSWPFESIDTTETQYSTLFKRFQDNGVVGDPSSPEAISAAPTTGMNLAVTDGFAFVRGFAYQNTDNVVLTCDAATSQPRIDTVILRLDPAANSILAAVKKGTPGASPVPPALEQTSEGVYEMPLYNVLVPASSTSLDPVNFSDRREFLGYQVGVWFDDSRPAGQHRGRMGFNLTSAKFEWWTGTEWSNAIPIDVALADNSVADSKLVTRPGSYRSLTANGTTAFSVGSANAGHLVTTTSASAVTITVNTGLGARERIDFIQDGAGQISFTPGAGVTLQSPSNKRKTKERYSAATLVSLDGTNYRLIGDLVA